MTAKEFLDQFELAASNQRVQLSEDRRYHQVTADVTIIHKRGSLDVPYFAGLGTLKPEQFVKPPSVRIIGTKVRDVPTLLERIKRDRYGLRLDTEAALKKVVRAWQPDKQDVLLSLVSEATTYDFQACQRIYNYFTLQLGFCVSDLERVREELDKM